METKNKFENNEEYFFIINALRDKRTERNIMQTDMAKLLGISQKQVSLYESGKRDMPVKILLKYCQILDIPLAEIVR